jgi:predicted lipid carrier protein YhbT
MTSALMNLHRAATRAVRTANRFLPYSTQKPVLSWVINQAFREPLLAGDLDFLQGRSVRIRVDDLGFDWLIGIGPERFLLLERGLPEDVCISGDSVDFALLATRHADPDTLFFQRRIRVEGDTELGLGVKNTMDGMDWDDLPPPLRALLKSMGRVIAVLAPLPDPTGGSKTATRQAG